jgi:CO dehydrogenase/acetyl-CoA synthase gamma subunit (corrinoid Fe-S protein)
MKGSKMVVEQEMATIYPPDAEDLSEFLPGTDCIKCGFSDCLEFAAALLLKEVSPEKCSDLSSEFMSILTSVLELDKSPIPYNMMMEQADCTLIEINGPGTDLPLLVTSNFQETVRIMKEILTRTRTKAFLLPTFTHGYSVDNAVPERMFKAVEIWKAMKDNSVEEKLDRSVLIIPGLAESEKTAIRQLTRWKVVTGPVSGFLLPLFLAQNR